MKKSERNLGSRKKLRKSRNILYVIIGLCVLLVILMLTIYASNSAEKHTENVRAATTRPLAKFEPPSGQTYIGDGGTSSQIPGFISATGIPKIAIYGVYAGPTEDLQSYYRQADSYKAAIMISWNVNFTNNNVTGGSQDAYYTKQAQEAKAYGKPIFMRPGWEMNGNWYPQWNVPASQYIASWQHIVDIYNKQGVTNVAWVYCPNEGQQANGDPSQFYPGDTYVDWICFDGYPSYRPNPADMITEPWGYDAMAAWAATKNKPLMVGEWARGDHSTNGGPDTDVVINLVFDWAEKYPDTVKALVYFDYKPNHTLASAPIAAATFKKRVANPRYIYTVITTPNPTQPNNPNSGTPIVPSFVCGGSGNCVPSQSPTPTGNSQPSNPLPSNPQTSIAPSRTTSPSPCSATSSVQARRNNHKHHSNGSLSNLFSQLMKLLQQLMQLLQQFVGGNNGGTPAPVPGNTGGPSNAPSQTPNQNPSNGPQPSSSPCATPTP